MILRPGSGCPPMAMPLRQLLAGLVDPGVAASCSVTDLQLDSRSIRPGALFVALNGRHAHGLRFARQAIDRGCAAILYDPAGAGSLADAVAGELPVIALENLAKHLGGIADAYFGHPSADMAVIGITGTNGKTSCSHFLAEALGAWQKAGVVGTLGWGLPGALRETSHTTMDAIETQRVLAAMGAEGFRVAAMEASSHGLDQGRLNGVRFRGAVFTNLSRDHLDYHETMEAYLKAKLRLLDAPGLAFVVFNADDPIAAPVVDRKPAGMPCIGFCAAGRDPGLGVPLMTYGEVMHRPDGIDVEVQYQGYSARVRAPVFGDFNAVNLVATLAVLVCLGHPLAEAAMALSRVLPVPGRMQPVAGAGKQAVIDYAHTPDALSSALSTLKKHCPGRLWVVFGCGGDRDRGKRAQMGAVAEQWADEIVLTDDNPRGEDGGAIIREILQGIVHKPVAVVRDRRAAIEQALAAATSRDLVLVAGKGHESTQEVRGVKYPFSDLQVLRDALNPPEPVS